MGHMIEEVALSRGHEIVCVIDSQPLPPPSPQEREPKEGKWFYTPEDGFESEAFRSADVAIEFTTPATAEENIRKAWAQGVPVVCGTTGWKPEELKIINYKLKIIFSKAAGIGIGSDIVLIGGFGDERGLVHCLFDNVGHLQEPASSLAESEVRYLIGGIEDTGHVSSPSHRFVSEC